jgi:hypothetical protein
MKRVDVTRADPIRVGTPRLDLESDHEGLAPHGLSRLPCRFELDAVYAVARAFENAPNTRHDSFVVTACRELQEQTHRMFSAMTDPNRAQPNRIVFTSMLDPYASDQELIDSARTTSTADRSRCSWVRLPPETLVAVIRGGNLHRQGTVGVEPLTS